MWFFTAWLSLALCWALAPPAAAKRASKPALPDFTGKYASDGILTFTDRNYTSIVLKAAVSLPDTFVVLYTAADPRFKCSACRGARAAVASAAMSAAAAGKTHRLHFAVIDFSDAQSAFQTHGLSSVPFVAAWTPAHTKRQGPLPKGSMLDPNQGITARQVLDLVQLQDVRVLVPVEAMAPWSFGLSAAIALAAAAVAGKPSRLVVWRNKYLAMAAGITVYAVGISGAILCIIRGMPMWMEGQRGSATAFSGGMRDQLGGEGVLLSALHVLAAGCFIGAAAATRMRGSEWARTGIIIACVAVGTAALLRISGLHAMRTRWYDESAVWPSWFTSLGDRAEKTARAWLQGRFGKAAAAWVPAGTVARLLSIWKS